MTVVVAARCDENNHMTMTMTMVMLLMMKRKAMTMMIVMVVRPWMKTVGNPTMVVVIVMTMTEM